MALALKDKNYWFSSNQSVVRINRQPQYAINKDGVEIETRERLTIAPVTSTAAESSLGRYLCTGKIRLVEVNGSVVKQFIAESIGPSEAKVLVESPSS